MNYITALLISVLIMHLSTFSYAQKKPLVLNGTATYTESNESYYIAGLYLSQPTADIDRIMSPETSKRMQLIITKDSWSKRSWTRNWRTRISINNLDTSNNTAIFEDIVKFTTLIKEDLLKGDEVIIEYLTAKTIIKINGEVVLESMGSPVMEYLLMTWIGKVPPSTKFRKNLLTQENGSTWKANSSILIDYTPPKNRLNIYSKWVNKKKTKKSKKEEEKILALKKEEEEKKLAKIRAEREIQRKKAEEKVKARKIAAKAKASRSKKQQAEARRAEQAKKNKQRIEEEKKLEQEYYLALIRWQIQRYINENVTYPHWAKNFSEEGLVEIIFLLDRERNIEIIEKTENVDFMLTKEVENVIEQGVQKTTFPEKITTDKWLINVNYLFSISGVKLPAAVPPEVPDHMGAQEDTRDQETLLKTYKKTLAADLKNTIQLPQRAKISGHKGTVTATITINRWGEIKKINITKGTRHKYLNDAFISDINKNSPYSVSPPNLKTNEIILEYEHKFSK